MRDWNESQQKELREIIWDLDLCGCGTDAEWEVILLLLSRADEHQKWIENKTYQELISSTEKLPGLYDKAEDASERWVEFGAKILGSWGLLEHGTSIGGAWLTDKGRLILDFLQEFGTDSGDMNDEKWPDWAESETIS